MNQDEKIIIILSSILVAMPILIALVTWHFNRIVDPLKKASDEQTQDLMRPLPEVIKAVSSFEKLKSGRKNVSSNDNKKLF